MKKVTLLMIFNAILFVSANSFAQVALKEISLKQQVDNSSLVIEGKVTSKKSFWSDKYIYTANTIEVYKVFKGESPATIEVVTLGGTIGLQALIVSSSLKLNDGDVGVFVLENTPIANTNSKSNTARYRAYGAVQGFYKYNVYDDVAVNPFNVKKGISDNFYQEIMSHTKSRFTEVSNFDIKNVQSKLTQNKNTLAPSAIAFSPSTTSAGTKSTITITIPGGNAGTNFGSAMGKVAFSNADDGGITFVDALDSQVVTWSSSTITVEVPSHAGTGKIRVTNSDDSSIISDDDLIVTYAETNVVYDEDDQTDIGGSNGPLKPKAYRVQHINENGSGGYTWQMHTEFNSNADAKASFLRAFNTWRNTTGINWILGPTTTIDEAMFESRPVESPATPSPSTNVIRFDNGSELETNELGKCYSWYKGCALGGGNFAWYVAEMDVVFDDATNWNFGPGTTTVFGNYDFESVALHELGHGHQLGHVVDDSPPIDNSNDVMHYALQFNEYQRVLTDNNQAAASIIQGRSTTASACGQPLMTDYALSSETNELSGAIHVYPNPAKGEFFISNDGLVNLKKVTIYDISGRFISKQDISTNSRLQTINTNTISKGVYFVNIYSDKTYITKKIIMD